jgi:malate/lactate dehydrogenase
VLGAGGVERVLDLPLSDEEQVAFRASVAAVREMLPALKL